MLAELIGNMGEEFAFTGTETLIYASSGGGLPALRIAMRLPQSSVYLSNIQTDPREYYPKFYRQLAGVAFAGMRDDEIDFRYTERLSSYGWDGNFSVTYAQNAADEFHYHHHYLPYMKAQQRAGLQKRIQFLVYHDSASGHGVLPRATELSIIDAMHRRSDIVSLLPEGRIFAHALDGMEGTAQNG